MPDSSTEKLAKLEKAVGELLALNRLSNVISQTTDDREILQIILAEALRLTNSQDGSILSLNETTQRPMQTVYKTVEPTSEASLSGLSDLIAGWVMKNKSHFVTADFSSDLRFTLSNEWFRGVRAILASPMQVHNVITGIVILTKDAAYTEDDIRLMNIIATQCGQLLANAKRFKRIVDENVELRQAVERRYDYRGIIGKSEQINRVFDMLELVIPGETRLLLQGESGTGKELIARTIHYNGPRKSGKFIAVDCGAIPETLLESELFGHVKGAFTGATQDKIGLFEAADQGTIFLDEISNTSLLFQAKLLRAIQEGEIKPVGATQFRNVDVRVIAASSADLTALVQEGKFRQDLYYRLNVITIHLPPLRDRLEDIRLLSEHFLAKFAEKMGKVCNRFDAGALQQLEAYSWPGNIRELENIIERAVTLAAPDTRIITTALLPPHLNKPSTLPPPSLRADAGLNSTLETVERQLLVEALQTHQQNRTAAAKSLGITRQTLIAKLKKHQIS